VVASEHALHTPCTLLPRPPPTSETVWYIPVCCKPSAAWDMTETLFGIPTNNTARTQFEAAMSKLPSRRLVYFQMGLSNSSWKTMAESCGLNPKGIVVWKLGGVDTLPPALLAEYTYGIYPDHGPTRTALSQSNAEYTITLNSMTISRTAGQLPPVRITQSVEGSLPIIWYMNTPDPMRLARTGSMMSFLQSINLACGTNKFAKTIALKALKTLIVQQKDPIPGTMVPQPTNFVHAFRLILRRFAKTSDDPYHALLLNAAANDLSVESFPEAWNVWKAMLDTFKEKTAAFDGPMANLVDHPSWKQALLELIWGNKPCHSTFIRTVWTLLPAAMTPGMPIGACRRPAESAMNIVNGCNSPYIRKRLLAKCIERSHPHLNVLSEKDTTPPNACRWMLWFILQEATDWDQTISQFTKNSEIAQKNCLLCLISDPATTPEAFNDPKRMAYIAAQAVAANDNPIHVDWELVVSLFN
jgi:hypothetical protein